MTNDNRMYDSGSTPTLTLVQTITVYCWTPAGFKLGIELAMDSLLDASALDAKMQALGYLPNLPGLEPGQNVAMIDTVVRRVHVNKDTGNETPVIDLYPAWDAGGKFGEFRYGHVYLNTPADIAEFEAQSGLKFSAIPVFEGQSPLQRIYVKQHACETRVARPFEFLKTEVGKHENGMTKYEYAYRNPITTKADNGNSNGASAPAQWADSETALKIKSYAITKDMDEDAINAALEGDYTDTDWLNANWTKARVFEALNVYAENRELPPAKAKGGAQ